MRNNSQVLKDLQRSAEAKRIEKESLLLETQKQNLKEFQDALTKLLKKEVRSIKSSIQSRSRLLEYKLLSLIILISIIAGMTAMYYWQKSQYFLLPKKSWTMKHIEGTTILQYIKKGE